MFFDQQDIHFRIPECWRIERLYDVAEIKTSTVDKKIVDGQNPVKLCNYQDVYYNNKITSDINFMKSTANNNEIDKFTLKKGDVVFTKDSEDPFDIGIPSYVDDEIEDLVCGYHLTIIKSFKHELLGKYAYYALKSELSKHQFALASNGVTRFGLTYQGTKNIRICIPSISEQKKIANFLDQKTTKIDRLIEKKKQLIEKLNEKLIAIITHAVTKGLDPSVPMKYSEVDWLGEVPTHWQIMKLNHVVKLKSGESITSMGINPSGTYPVFGGNGIRGYCEEYTHSGYYVLIGRQGALCGNVNYASGRFWASEHAIVVTPDRSLDIFWLGELLRVMNLGQYSVSAAQPGIGVEQISKLKIPYPSKKEQLKISDYIKNENIKIESLITAMWTAINKLSEYRSALITAAVTGKIDVRDIPIIEQEAMTCGD